MPAFLFLLYLFSFCVLCTYVWMWMSLHCVCECVGTRNQCKESFSLSTLVFETGSFTELRLSSSGRLATGPWGFARVRHSRAGPTDTHLGLRMDVRCLTQTPVL